ncbi:FtsH-binding integral membrane protein [Bacillus mesophilus]|uniref:Uncharacterized protein n=1 Tax=Bacillus mesophilus TaxID=1808955 RepID=A0A6M0Q9A0_9BACI|nr:hypothetical protein [Bacillus mesophilus]MBM7661653.1 FtsH-binding integral membrane protein [Bacillus mesophilus]NEY72319.1 hypothetical protein [Bacillus mesophilus]
MRKKILVVLSVIYILNLIGMLNNYLLVGGFFIVSELVMMLIGYMTYRIARNRSKQQHFWPIWIYSTFVGLIPFWMILEDSSYGYYGVDPEGFMLALFSGVMVKFISIFVFSRKSGKSYTTKNLDGGLSV